MSAAKILLMVGGVVFYVVLSHTALAMHDAHSIWRQLAVLLLLGALIAIVCWGIANIARQLHAGPSLSLLCATLAGALMVAAGLVFWPTLLLRLDRMYLVEHVATNGMLCWFFGHTLFGGHTPIITTLARAIHGEIPDTVVRYTRKVTLAWALFFAAQVLVSLLLFRFASIETWSIFANVLNWPLVILMFAVEYAFRRRVDPDFQHATIRQSVAAYFSNKSEI